VTRVPANPRKILCGGRGAEASTQPKWRPGATPLRRLRALHPVRTFWRSQGQRRPRTPPARRSANDPARLLPIAGAAKWRGHEDRAGYEALGYEADEGRLVATSAVFRETKAMKWKPANSSSIWFSHHTPLSSLPTDSCGRSLHPREKVDLAQLIAGHNPFSSPSAGEDCSVASEHRQALARLQIPDANGMVVRARDGAFAIG
jgi:hypothetical protein